MNKARILGKKPIFSGRVVDQSVERIELPTGRETTVEFVRHRGAAAVAALREDGHLIMVRHYRHCAGGWLLEVPAGKIDGGEDPEDCARREVEEETGYRAGQLVPLGWIWTTPGFSDEKIWLYLARDLDPSTQKLESDEALTVEEIPFKEGLRMARDGMIQDAKTICTLLRAETVISS